MKKNTIYIYSLILILLITCTIFSNKIEEEMTLDAVVIKAESSPIRPLHVPIGCLFYDEEGYHLYGIYEGIGWEEGTRVKEIPKSEYEISGNYVVLKQLKTKPVSKNMANGIRNPENGIIEWNIIKTASRHPRVGELVCDYDKASLEEDIYLAIYINGIPKDYNVDPVYGEIIATNDNAILILYKRAIKPFMVHNVKEILEVDQTSKLTGENWKLFSISEIEEFLKSMRYIGILGILIISCLVLWVFSCLLAKDKNHYFKYIILNSCVIIGLLVCMIIVIQKIDMHSSLLPTDNIFNFKFYKEEFSAIYDSLKGLDYNMDL